MSKWSVPFKMFGSFVVEADDEQGAAKAVSELAEDGIFPDWEGIDYFPPEPASRWEEITR